VRSHLAEPVFGRGTAVHERLGHHGEARVHDHRLVDVEHEVRVLDDVHPEPQWQTAGRGSNVDSESLLIPV